MCQEGVWKKSGRSLKVVLNVSERCLRGVQKVSGFCLNGNLMVAGGCLDGIWRKVSERCFAGVCEGLSRDRSSQY